MQRACFRLRHRRSSPYFELFHSLQTEFGLTFLFVSNDLGVVQHMCYRIAAMYMGKLLNMLTKRAYLPTRNILTRWCSVRRLNSLKKA